MSSKTVSLTAVEAGAVMGLVEWALRSADTPPDRDTAVVLVRVNRLVKASFGFTSPSIDLLEKEMPE